jgi:undecaprenyl-diphosphatase
MRSKQPPPASLSWPERRLVWVERERLVVLWMHGASTRSWVVSVLAAVSRIGDGWLWYGIVVCLPWAGGPVGTSASIRMFGVGLVDIVIYKIVKRWIARPRPFRTCAGIRECARSLDEFSFPSGHTLHSVACSLILTAYYPTFALFVWPFTVLVAVSRVILGLHYPSDVIVGALIGAATAAISFNLL